MLGSLIDPWAAVGTIAVTGRLRSEGGIIALFKTEGDATVPGFGWVARLREVYLEGALRRGVSGYDFVGGSEGYVPECRFQCSGEL